MQIVKRIYLFFLLFFFSTKYLYAQTCTVDVTSPTVNFGTFSAFQGTDITGINEIFTIRCHGHKNPIAYTLKLTAGGDNSYTPRHMLRNGTGPETLNYNFYIDPGATTTIWGDGTSGTSFVNVPITSHVDCRNPTPCTHTAYGRLPLPQTGVRGGTYSTTITATLTYNP